MRPVSTVEVQALTLDRLKVRARKYLSPQLAHDAHADVYVDRMTDAIVGELTTYVMVHRLLTDDQSASYERTVTVEQGTPRYIVASFSALTLTATALALLLGSLAVLALACAVALAGVIIYAANPPRTHTRTVSGTVTIPATYYATFPENTMVYPSEWGRVVQHVQPSVPYWNVP